MILIKQLNFDPNNLEIYKTRASVYYHDLQDYEKAIIDYEFVLKKDPNDSHTIERIKIAKIRMN